MLPVTGALLALFANFSGGAIAQEDHVPLALVAAGTPSHATLFIEDGSPQGHSYPGAVIWRIDRMKVAEHPDKIVVHADVAIPKTIKMKIDFERNLDSSLPASHTLKLTLSISPDVQSGEVISVPGLLMKFSERGKGVPLSSQTAKITNDVFLIGLSSAARESNLLLLKERQWIDIPMVFGNQHRAILAIEKGYRGEDVFNAAMLAWGDTSERL